jgi:pimeloyl-ACP methyl ester carboxylesterase
VAVWYGEKEPNMKKAVQKLKRAWPNAEIHPFEGYGHGEIIANPDIMAKEIKEFIRGNHQ